MKINMVVAIRFYSYFLFHYYMPRSSLAPIKINGVSEIISILATRFQFCDGNDPLLYVSTNNAFTTSGAVAPKRPVTNSDTYIFHRALKDRDPAAIKTHVLLYHCFYKVRKL
jgi:hypothetical protein